MKKWLVESCDSTAAKIVLPSPRRTADGIWSVQTLRLPGLPSARFAVALYWRITWQCVVQVLPLSRERSMVTPDDAGAQSWSESVKYTCTSPEGSCMA